jgi:hypothetical protein
MAKPASSRACVNDCYVYISSDDDDDDCDETGKALLDMRALSHASATKAPASHCSIGADSERDSVRQSTLEGSIAAVDIRVRSMWLSRSQSSNGTRNAVVVMRVR